MYDAVVVGAGWAGIRAAETLMDEGLTIIVLEANDYIGGRAWSINGDDSSNNPNTDDSNIPYDVGAEWLYNNGNDMEETLIAGGFLDNILENDKYTAMPIQNGQYYQSKRNDNGEITTNRMEDSGEWMSEIWTPFLQYRKDRVDELYGSSYEGWSYVYVVSLYQLF